MRRLTILVLILAVLYGGYWFVGRAAVERGGVALLSQLQDEGYDVSYGRLHTVGFPSRFDTTVTDIRLADPARGIVWEAPFFQILALSYQPNKVIAIAPPIQTITLPGQILTASSDKMRASVSVAASTDLTLDTITAEVGAADVASDAGWNLTLDHALFAMRPAAAPQTYDLYFDAANLRLPAQILDLIDPDKTLPEPIEDSHLDSTITFDKPIDRFAGAGQGPAPTHIALKDLRITWGPMILSASGDLSVDPAGVSDGRITVLATGWRQMIDIAVNAGLIDRGVAPTWINMATLMAKGGETVDLPVTFAGGMMSVGPLPLGPAPRFR